MWRSKGASLTSFSLQEWEPQFVAMRLFVRERSFTKEDYNFFAKRVVTNLILTKKNCFCIMDVSEYCSVVEEKRCVFRRIIYRPQST